MMAGGRPVSVLGVVPVCNLRSTGTGVLAGGGTDAADLPSEEVPHPTPVPGIDDVGIDDEVRK